MLFGKNPQYWGTHGILILSRVLIYKNIFICCCCSRFHHCSTTFCPPVVFTPPPSTFVWPPSLCPLSCVPLFGPCLHSFGVAHACTHPPAPSLMLVCTCSAAHFHLAFIGSLLFCYSCSAFICGCLCSSRLWLFTCSAFVWLPFALICACLCLLTPCTCLYQIYG